VVAGVDETERSDLEERYALKNPLLDKGRTWEYRLENTSVQHVRRLIADPRVEDTALIDRNTATVPAAESVGAKVRSALVTFLPVLRIRVWPGMFSAANATALFYYLCLFIPILALMSVGVLLSRPKPVRSVRSEAARGLSLATLCLLVDAFILRDPVGARIGAVAPVLAIVGTWTVGQLASSLPVQLGSAANPIALKSVRFLFVLCLGLGVFLAVSDRVTLSPNQSKSWRGTVLRLAAFPPSEDLLPRGGQAGLIRYARACTRPQDRLLATWFIPQLFTMAGRGFAGGMVVFFGGHWSSMQYQQRIVDKLTQQSVPLVFVEKATSNDFRNDFQLVYDYLQKNYRLAAESSLGDPEMSDDGYQVLARQGLPVLGRYEPWGLPCFR